MAASGRLGFQSREVGQVLVVDLSGDVVLGEEATALRKYLRAKLDEKRRPILLNLAQVRYMDSTGVGVLVEAKAHSMGNGTQFRLCNVPPFTNKILRQLNLHEILGVYATESEALASIQ